LKNNVACKSKKENRAAIVHLLNLLCYRILNAGAIFE